jgi:hypothetical protein
MDSNSKPLDSLQMEENIAIPPKKIIRFAGAGIISMTIAVVLLVGLANLDGQSGLVLVLPLFLVVLGLIIPIWMFVRSLLLLIKKQNPGGPKRTFAIFLTIFLGFVLLLLFAAFVLYIRADRQPPF